MHNIEENPDASENQSELNKGQETQNQKDLQKETDGEKSEAKNADIHDKKITGDESPDNVED